MLQKVEVLIMFTMKSFLCIILMAMIVMVVFGYIFGKDSKSHVGVYTLAALVLFSAFGAAFAMSPKDTPDALIDPTMSDYVTKANIESSSLTIICGSDPEDKVEIEPAETEGTIANDEDGEVLGVFDEIDPSNLKSPSKAFFDTFFDGLISGFDRLLDSNDPSGLTSFGNSYMEKGNSINVDDIPILRDFTNGMDRFMNHVFNKLEHKMLSLFDI